MALTINHETNDISNATGTIIVNGVVVGGDNTPPFYGARGIYGGGYYSGYKNNIDYITISTAGNATDFGDLIEARSELAGGSNGNRGIFAGGVYGAAKNDITYITIATTGNATDFGDLTLARYSTGAVANTIRAVIGSGKNASAQATNVMDYITIATTGNATDFGDMTSATQHQYANTNSEDRGLFISHVGANVIEYITIATTGNSTDFGDLTASRYSPGACTDGSRAVIGGGGAGTTNNPMNTIDYITISTAGNATDFGDMDQNVMRLTGTGDGTTGVFMGGYTSSFGGISRNFIQKITIQTTGNASDFGDLTNIKYGGAAFSGGA